MIRYRFARAVRAIGDRYRAGELAAAPAGEAVSRELRRFLHQVTGVRAEYMQLDDIASSEIASAAPLLANLIDVQFNAASTWTSAGQPRRRGADPVVDLTWMLVVIAGCVALAVCIAAVLLRPMGAERRRLRPLANVGAPDPAAGVRACRPGRARSRPSSRSCCSR